MSSRQEQKQKLREEREARERQEREAAARRGRLMRIGVAVAVVVVAAAVAIALASGGGSSSKSSGPGPSGALQVSPGPWQPELAHLQERATKLGLPDPSDTVFHVHAHLDVYTDGKRQTVPAQVGIDSQSQYLASLHTHDTSGVIHMEAVQPYPFKLGQVFEIWGVKFTPTQLGAYRPGNGLVLQTWVNGKQIKNPVAYVVKPHDKIIVGFGAPGSFPTQSSSSSRPASSLHSVSRTPATAGRDRVGSELPANLADLVGDTPLVRLTRVAPSCGAELIGKLEAHNPAGSVKDRIGVAMIEAAEAEGRIEPGRTTIVEATSGNTGIALAFVCAAKGYELVLSMPQGMSREREGLLRLYGARVEVTESLGGMNEAVDAAQRIAAELGDCFIPDQFSNPANPAVHRRTTAEEIWRDTGGAVEVFVAGVGTGGTITGAGERLKELNPDLRVVAVEPKASAVLSGGQPGPHKIQGIGAGFVPAILNLDVIDEIVPVDDEDAIDTARLVSRREGILAGISGGAALWAAIEVGSRPELEGARVVAIVPDSGERYVSTPFFAP